MYDLNTFELIPNGWYTGTNTYPVVYLTIKCLIVDWFSKHFGVIGLFCKHNERVYSKLFCFDKSK
jgi:hypothetical protein